MNCFHLQLKNRTCNQLTVFHTLFIHAAALYLTQHFIIFGQRYKYKHKSNKRNTTNPLQSTTADFNPNIASLFIIKPKLIFIM